MVDCQEAPKTSRRPLTRAIILVSVISEPWSACQIRGMARGSPGHRPSKVLHSQQEASTTGPHRPSYKAPVRRQALTNVDFDAPAAAAKRSARATRARSFGLVCSGLAVASVSFYLASLYVSYTRCPHQRIPVTGPLTQAELTDVYNRTASSFDADIGLSERLMGVTGLRKKLARQCHGDVLEVSSGTARNLGYYRFGRSEQGARSVRSLTLVDVSAEMVEQGKKKWDVLSKRKDMRLLGVPVRFWNGDAAGSMPDPPVVVDNGKAVAVETGVSHKDEPSTPAVAKKGGHKGYDTILQTMGLCSVPSPVDLLRNLSLHLDPTNPEARILLLEHGRSYYAWLNRILDQQASAHADQHGCWWNRDIGQIIEESGLEIVRERRRHFGTTWIFELKPKPGAWQIEETKAEGMEVEKQESQDTPTGLGAWLPRWTYEKICRR